MKNFQGASICKEDQFPRIFPRLTSSKQSCVTAFGKLISVVVSWQSAYTVDVGMDLGSFLTGETHVVNQLQRLKCKIRRVPSAQASSLTMIWIRPYTLKKQSVERFSSEDWVCIFLLCTFLLCISVCSCYGLVEAKWGVIVGFVFPLAWRSLGDCRCVRC